MFSPSARTRTSAVAAAMAGLVGYDLLQRERAILRNFPEVGHVRYLLEAFGPELRQYIVTSNNEERPFSRDQRRWIAASAEGRPNVVGFGTDDEMESVESLPIIKHSPFPAAAPARGEAGGAPLFEVPAGKVLGGAHGRRGAFRPPSVVNISGMSYGALSAPAVMSLNRGAMLAGALQNTGEGGLSRAHEQGGDLIFQIGTGYFGCRDERGRFSMPHLRRTIDRAPVRAIEIELSQGAKPGLGGLLPAAKVTADIAAVREVPVGEDCVSPPAHSAFSDVDGLIEFVEAIAQETGLPVGIKSAVGESRFWRRLAGRMAATGDGPDFINVDGGEGGTGAAPLAVLRPRGPPVQARLLPRVRNLRERGARAGRRVHRRGAPRLPRQCDLRVRARVRHGPRRPRGDAIDRMHPGPALPHGPLSVRRGDTVALADARPGPRPQERSSRQLHRRSGRRSSRSRAPAASPTRRSSDPSTSRSSPSATARQRSPRRSATRAIGR